MNKQLIWLGALMVMALAMGPGLRAQSGAQRADIGPVTLTWGQSGRYAGDKLYLLGGVHMASTGYDLKAQSVTISLQTGGKAAGGFGVAGAVAVGDAERNTQVTGRFTSAALARTYIVTGDKAVYVPEPGRKNGGCIDFTGNVVITVRAPQALDGPAVTHVSQATVLTGAGADYPQVMFGAGTMTFTPLQSE